MVRSVRQEKDSRRVSLVLGLKERDVRWNTCGSEEVRFRFEVTTAGERLLSFR